MNEPQLAAVKIGLLSVSDRASAGIYQDKGIPALKKWLENAICNPIVFAEQVIPDDQATIENALIDLTDNVQCHLVFTTGGTGPSPRDVTPEATLAISHKEMPGFGEQMRQISLQFVPTAILSRQTAVIRQNCLVVNLPGQPKAIAETLNGIFAAIPYCIDLIGGPYIETHEHIVKAFRPQSALQKTHQGS